jgi:16S rRNA (cytosine1402-N4)-methyltransferase
VRARHEPVLLAETMRWLRHGPGLYLDATLGDGGHAEALLEAEPGARLLGCDRDREALDFARARLARFGDRVTVAQAAFRDLPRARRAAGDTAFTGALFDLGLSSRQIDDPARGMSFQTEGPLDLRMDPTHGESAEVRLRTADEGTIAQVLRAHGDLREAGRLARALVAAARDGRLATTRDLVAALDRALGGRPHPRRYAQAFQALRIWVNDEAAELEAALQWLPEAMSPGGVVVTIAYHSGEDRRIKQSLRGTQRTFPTRRRPPRASDEPAPGPWEELTRKVVTPTQDEVGRNPRARSARLRAFRRRPS